jgi:ribulose-bisphosphate carboxylase large chain
MKSSKSYLRYVDLNFQPNPEKHLLGKYFVKKNNLSKLEGLAFLGSIAAESSTGTWIEVAHDSKQNVNVSGIVYKFDETTNTAEIAYPIELFEPGNISQLMTVFAGNAFGLADISALKLVDIYLPPKYLESFSGPKYGIEGIYSVLNKKMNSPVIGSIMKPKCGLDVDTFSEIAFDAWMGMYNETGIDGVDMVKDDEALTSQTAFKSNFYDRITKTIEAAKRVEDKTGKKKIFVPNVTHSDFSESLRRAEFVQNLGGYAVMIDYVMSGCSLLNTLRNQNYNLIIHGHRTLFAALHRAQDFGIDYQVWAKLFRAIGGDQIHTGTPALGVMSGDKKYVEKICSIVRDKQLNDGRFSMNWSNHKSCLPICGAGLDPLTLKPLVDSLGADVALFAGGGTHGHPNGTKAGASSLRAAVNALEEKISLHSYSDKLNHDWLTNGVQFFSNFDRQNPNDEARANM